MRCVTGCLERLFWLLLAPATASAQPYAPRDVYGNSLSVPGYGYPPGYPADGYSDNYPLVTRPASRPRVQGCGPDDRICVRRDRRCYEPEDEGLDYAISPQYERQVVSYRGSERPGTVIIDTPAKYLYLVQPGGRAIRYGIGVGRPGLRMGRPEIGHA